jgi:hypothetical protein
VVVNRNGDILFRSGLTPHKAIEMPHHVSRRGQHQWFYSFWGWHSVLSADRNFKGVGNSIWLAKVMWILDNAVQIATGRIDIALGAL